MRAPFPIRQPLYHRRRRRHCRRHHCRSSTADVACATGLHRHLLSLVRAQLDQHQSPCVRLSADIVRYLICSTAGSWSLLRCRWSSSRRVGNKRPKQRTDETLTHSSLRKEECERAAPRGQQLLLMSPKPVVAADVVVGRILMRPLTRENDKKRSRQHS